MDLNGALGNLKVMQNIVDGKMSEINNALNNPGIPEVTKNQFKDILSDVSKAMTSNDSDALGKLKTKLELIAKANKP